MVCRTWSLIFCVCLGGCAAAADLPVAPPEELLRVYSQLRALRGSDRWAVNENVVWQRDAATFTFVEGRLTFAEPVAGRVLAAVFEGRAAIELNPPTPIARNQLARFTKGPKLEDTFRHAVFFFTDNSWAELQRLVKVQAGGDAAAAGKALASAQKKYADNYNDWWENAANRNPPMRNLAARMLADLSDPTSRGFFLADFKGDHYGDLLYHISWNRDVLFLPEFSNDEEVMLLHPRREEYPEWWAGFHVAEEYATTLHPEHRALLAHCREERIDAEIGKDNRLSATAVMEFEVPGGPVRVLPLNLQGVLRISSVTDEASRKLSFLQEDRQLDHDPWVILPEPAQAGKVYKLQIEYEEDATRDSRIVHQQGPGLYYVTSRESWFPSFGAFDDRTRYVLHVRSPGKFKLVGTGHLVSSEKKKDFVETGWESEIPYSVVGFNYGDFVAKSQADAELTVTAYSGREIPDELRGVGGGMAGASTGGFNTAANAGYAAGVSYQALKLFEHYYGPLPFKTVSVTEQPVRGYGQSWPTLIFLPYDSLLDETTRHFLGLGNTGEAREFYNIVAVHEMAHQWWGHMVGQKTYHDQWLSEGFAEFSAGLYLKKFDPKKFKGFWDLRRKWLFAKNRAGHHPVDVGPLWLGIQLPAYLEEELYQRLVYFKGAYVLEMLRTLMEDSTLAEPDTRFIGMMRDFASTYAAKNASTEDFRRVVEKHVGQPMGWFFDQWVYGTEIPRYEFSYQLKDGPAGKTVAQIMLKQSEVSDSFLTYLPFYSHLNGQVRRLGLLRIKGSSTTNAEIPLPFRPEKITLDDYHSVLCKAE